MRSEECKDMPYLYSTTVSLILKVENYVISGIVMTGMCLNETVCLLSSQNIKLKSPKPITVNKIKLYVAMCWHIPVCAIFSP